MLVLADLRIGPDITASVPLFKIGAVGVVLIDDRGIAVDLNVEMTVNAPNLGLQLAAEARLIMNTAGVNMSLEIPDTLWGFFQDLEAGKSPTGGTVSAALLSGPGSMTGEFLARLQECGAVDGDADDNRCYVISGNGPRLIAGSNVDEGTINGLLGNGGTITLSPTPGAYLAVVLTGKLTIVGFADAYGLVALSVRSGAFEMVVSVRFQLGASQNTSLNVNAEGILGLYADGVFLKVNVGIQANLLSVFDLNVTGLLEIDTTHGNARLPTPGRLLPPEPHRQREGAQADHAQRQPRHRRVEQQLGGAGQPGRQLRPAVDVRERVHPVDRHVQLRPPGQHRPDHRRHRASRATSTRTPPSATTKPAWRAATTRAATRRTRASRPSAPTAAPASSASDSAVGSTSSSSASRSREPTSPSWARPAWAAGSPSRPSSRSRSCSSGSP